jgi:hypothetical protein
MTLRESFRPLRPDLDNFLFATVGTEHEGMPLSMVSALTRVGLDPWEEAGRLSSLGKREAVEQLARLIAELPGTDRPLEEAREIARGLVQQLPRYDNASPSSSARKIGRRYRWPTMPAMPRKSQLMIFCVVAAVAALVSIFMHGGLPFGIGSL